MDATRLSNRLGVLHGIPILVKCICGLDDTNGNRDSFATGPELGMKTTDGSPALGTHY